MILIILDILCDCLTYIVLYEFGKFLVIKYKHMLIMDVPDEDCEIL